MSETAIEDHIYDFIAAAIAAAVDESDPLHQAELHDNVYRTITTEYGIRIGDGESSFAPNPGATEILEFDGVVPIVIFSQVNGADRSDRADARGRMIGLAKAVSMLFLEDPTMGGRVTDSRISRAPRGWDSIKSTPYSVANLHLLVNETGGQLS